MTITGDAGIDTILSGILNPPKPLTEQEKILKEFNRNINDIAGLLNDIKTIAVEKRMGMKKVDWTAVGDTDSVKEMLNEIVRFFNNKEE